MRKSIAYRGTVPAYCRRLAQERLADPRVTYASTITATELKEHLEVLASDDFWGGKQERRARKWLQNISVKHIK